MDITRIEIKQEHASWLLRVYAGRKQVGGSEAYKDWRTALKFVPYLMQRAEDESSPDLAYYEHEE